jgi:hypothetical protein
MTERGLRWLTLGIAQYASKSTQPAPKRINNPVKEYKMINGSRKHQIIAAKNEWDNISSYTDMVRNETIEEIAQELETKFCLPFGKDTVQSFTAYVRKMKK